MEEIVQIAIIVIILLIFSLYTIYRNNQVYNFRNSISNRCFEWSNDHLMYTSAYFWMYHRLPSYDYMVYHFWLPLKLESYIEAKYIDILNGNPEIEDADLSRYHEIEMFGIPQNDKN